MDMQTDFIASINIFYACNYDQDDYVIESQVTKFDWPYHIHNYSQSNKLPFQCKSVCPVMIIMFVVFLQVYV